MSLLTLTPQITWLEAVRALAANKRSRGFGLLVAARPAFLAALQASAGVPMLVITDHPHIAADLAEDLAVWTELPVLTFPALEALPYERVYLDRAVLAERQRGASDLASGKAGIVVAPVRALLQPTPAVGAEGAFLQSLRRNASIHLDSLLTDWVERGYTRSATVDEPATFAARGGVVDIFPVGADAPVRIELFGNVIESLRTFDPETQRSLEPIDAVEIPTIARLDDEVRRRALGQLSALDTSTLTAEAETLWKADLAKLEAGAGLDELTILEPYLLPERRSLLERLPASARVVVLDPHAVAGAMQDLWTQAQEVQADLEAMGALPADMLPSLLEPGQIETELRSRPTIELFPGSPEEPGDVGLNAVFSPAKLYAGRLRALQHDLQGHRGERVVIATRQADRISELLEAEEIPFQRFVDPDYEAAGIRLVGAAASGGWHLPAINLTLLTDHELFGHTRARRRAPRRRAAREAFFARFSPGEYVVHLEHGIGRFEEVIRMQVEGTEREYAVVQYAGSDRVYVPTDQLERLTRYIGVGDAAPQLSRLGGGEWLRARQRAKEAAADIAKELIDLYARRRAQSAHAFAPDTPWQGELESSFPFPETPDQLRAVDEVKIDMESPSPMDRLVCADVGYGKTEVAVRAAFKAVMDGKQVAFLVPTTILAQQHFETLRERFSAFPVTVDVLSRFRSPKEQRELLRRAATGELDVLIGTHRLLQKDVSWKNLGLLIVDEEQRFGVKHKEKLKQLRAAIDVLTLTATPIPRTLHMGLVGIREISVIETPPEGRLPIKTYLQPYDDRLIREAILREMDRDGQVYFVHNKVATIDAVAERIRRLTPEARILVAHGQMDDGQLEKVMLSFAHHEADVLLCSTIIENGLDIPNVNTIVLSNAQKLGLTQLYQLRGRVGRGANQAYAYLLYPRDIVLSRDALRRMEAVFEAQELGAGMTIALRDLEIRGVGNLLGAEQSGHATAVGFDLYTRMIGEAVELLRGVPAREQVAVSMDLPLTMYLPNDYIGDEAERLTLYRRLATVSTPEELDDLASEIADRFGRPPEPVENLLTSVRIKLAAQSAGITSISLNREQLILRAHPPALYDRVSLYRRYGSEARISTNVLRIPRHVLPEDWLGAVDSILQESARLRAQLKHPQSVGA